MERKQKPLEGITVVELAMFVAAPSAARMLADWGATVIKIESPKGDPMRFMASWYPCRLTMRERILHMINRIRERRALF